MHRAGLLVHLSSKGTEGCCRPGAKRVPVTGTVPRISESSLGTCVPQPSLSPCGTPAAQVGLDWVGPGGGGGQQGKLSDRSLRPLTPPALSALMHCFCIHGLGSKGVRIPRSWI